MAIWGLGQATQGRPGSIGASVTALADHYVPLKERLTGWWNGSLAGSKPSGSGVRHLTTDIAVHDDGQAKTWSPARMKVAQDVYGEGFIEPGGAQFARKLLAPADADPSKTILDLSVGLGGTAIALAREHDVWMETLEPETSLIDTTRDLVRTNMLTRRISIKPVDYSNFKLKSEKYDVIYSRDRLFTTAQKARIIGQAAAALKKTGKLLIIDYMVTSHDNVSEDYRNWIKTEPEKPLPWTETQYQEAIAGAGLKVRASQDFSPQYVEHIESGWQKMLRELESNTIDRGYVNSLIREGELWLARSRALEAGVIKVTRLFATRA